MKMAFQFRNCRKPPWPPRLERNGKIAQWERTWHVSPHRFQSHIMRCSLGFRTFFAALDVTRYLIQCLYLDVFRKVFRKNTKNGQDGYSELEAMNQIGAVVKNLMEYANARYSGHHAIKNQVRIIRAAFIEVRDGNTIEEGRFGSVRKLSREVYLLKVTKRAITSSRVWIGWVGCRLRKQTSLKWCFRCLEFGHMAKNYTGIYDRSELYRKCGEKGHIAKSCDESSVMQEMNHRQQHMPIAYKSDQHHA